MRPWPSLLLVLIAMLGLTGKSNSLPVAGDNHDMGKQSAATSPADQHPSTSSTTHHQASSPQLMNVDHKAPANDGRYATSSPATGHTALPQRYNGMMIDPNIHHPDKVKKKTKGFHYEYEDGEMDHYPYLKELSKAKVASEGLHHIINGRPVRVALEDGVEVLHQPGPENKKAALDAHFKDNIHQIERTNNHHTPFRIVPPRNPAGKPLSEEESKALQTRLKDTTAHARLMRDREKKLPAKRYDAKTNTLRKVQPDLSSLPSPAKAVMRSKKRRMMMADKIRSAGNNRYDRIKSSSDREYYKSRFARYKPY
jgi:hypothetical protein